MTELLTIGEPMAVLAAQDVDTALKNVQHYQRYLAGAELNVAVGVSRLGHQTEYISAVGEDPFGQYITEEITRLGIGTRYLNRDRQHKTGFYLKQAVSQGDPGVYYYRKNSAAANFAAASLAQVDLRRVKLAHISGIFAALSTGNARLLSRFCKRLNDEQVMTTFDPNLRPTLWPSRDEMVAVTNDLARHANLILPGVNEGEVLVGSQSPEVIADFYLKRSAVTQTVIVKLGAKGAFIKTRDGMQKYVAGFRVPRVVDTVGAGDGFAVGLISGLLEGLDLAAATQRGCAIGALAVTTPGDNDGYPTRAALNQFYHQQLQQA